MSDGADGDGFGGGSHGDIGGHHGPSFGDIAFGVALATTYTGQADHISLADQTAIALALSWALGGSHHYDFHQYNYGTPSLPGPQHHSPPIPDPYAGPGAAEAAPSPLPPPVPAPPIPLATFRGDGSASIPVGRIPAPGGGLLLVPVEAAIAQLPEPGFSQLLTRIRQSIAAAGIAGTAVLVHVRAQAFPLTALSPLGPLDATRLDVITELENRRLIQVSITCYGVPDELRSFVESRLPALIWDAVSTPAYVVDVTPAATPPPRTQT